ncbi:Transmembrane BAX inhibitor motif-containing protein 4 [Borealophlyctis nickersoniae]|nr:Transmembrane BAX inhibitor motif-containing protein 4 [Borealophlyctis nickersoniae]
MASPKRPQQPQQPQHATDDDEIGYATHAGYGAVPAGPSTQPPAYAAGDVPDDFKYGVSVENTDLAIRMAFVRKVYTILATQLGATAVVSGIFMASDTVKGWVQTNIWAVYLSWLLTLGLLIALIVKRRSHPTNLYLLAGFTLLEAYSIGTIVTFYDSLVVLQAVILTFSLFVGLTLFTLQTKYDFTSWGPFLFGSLWVIVIAMFLQIFLPFSQTMHLVIAVATAILFCGFIVYDTQQIFARMSPEEYIMASVELYLDVINLFLAILRILNNRND